MATRASFCHVALLMINFYYFDFSMQYTGNHFRFYILSLVFYCTCKMSLCLDDHHHVNKQAGTAALF